MRIKSDKEFDIINQIKEGDTSLFRLLIDSYKDVSFSLACSILRNEQDAEDSLQESFIKAYTGLKRFNFNSSFATWLYKIVVNTSNTKFKTQQRQKNIIKIDTYYETIGICEDDSTYTAIESSEQKRLVNNILDSIKQDESLMLRLFYLAEMSIKEVMDITGYKESKIKVTLHRARKSFEKEFEKKYSKENIVNQ